MNRDMVRRHAAWMLRSQFPIGTVDDGSGIRLGMSVGGAAINMSEGFTTVPWYPPGSLVKGIFVNGQGQRFINEDCYPGRIGQAALFRQGLDCWVVLDEQGYEEVPESERWGVLPHHVADTLEELESLTGMPPGSLAATVALYNAHAARGEDPWFHKDPRWLRPLDPPYAAIDPHRSFRAPTDPPVGSGAAVFTLGGLATDVDGHVLDLDGKPVPGLLAAGRASSGLAAWGYISGTSLGDGTFFGRRAGRTAAGHPVQWDAAAAPAASSA